MNHPNQERCEYQSVGSSTGTVRLCKSHGLACLRLADTQNHSTMEGWEEEFDAKFYPLSSSEEMTQIVADPYRTGFFWGKKEALEKCRSFIRTLLAKERESAERRGREKAVEYIMSKFPRAVPTSELMIALEAARKGNPDV